VWDSGDKECVFPSQTFSQPVVGDWNGDGKTKVGYWLYGLWHLDYLGAGTYSTTYSFIGPDLYTKYKPVVGDWNGDKITELGVYNNQNGVWYLDYNGDGQRNSGSETVGYNFGVGTPVIGDWNGDGKFKIGVFKDGVWNLDYIGNGSVIKVYSFGSTGSTPIIGDWNGDGKSKIGVYNNGDWNLDYDGNGVWDATADKVYNIGVGTPVVGKWS
jgi:hypothetical protein